MIPRTKTGIFTVGDKGHAAAAADDSGDKMLLVGLRIISSLSSHGRQPANIVVDKTTLRAAPCRNLTPLPELGFLKACFLCKKELGPKSDVYIYRGEQGFCSTDCRCRQISIDERKEYFDISLVSGIRSTTSARQPQRYRPPPVPARRVRDSNYRRRPILVSAGN